MQPADITDAALAAPGILLSAMALHAQLELAAWLRPRTAATIYFDPQEDYIAGNEAELLDAVAACDVFLPSEIEAAALAGTPIPARPSAPSSNSARTPSSSNSPRPAVWSPPASIPNPTLVPTDVVDPVDSTGAGDAFCGAFAAEHLRSADPYAAARAGAAAARIAVSANGIDGLLAAVTAEAAAMTRITVINPNTSAELTATITAAAQAVAGPGVTVTGVNPAVGVPSVESHAEEADRRRRGARTGRPDQRLHRRLRHRLLR